LLSTRSIETRTREASTKLPRIAEGLSDAMPRLSADARRAAASINAGVHGRRRAGQGETFWQFRPFTSGEPATKVDWRRSARDDRLYVREREWEAAQAIHIFIDRSPSMDYRSGQAGASKQERAIVLGLAAADMLVRGGERAGLMGTTRPTASRRIIERLAEAMVMDKNYGRALPREPLPPRSEAVVITDALSPLGMLDGQYKAIAQRGARGHIVLVRDPAEEDFPFSGQTEFVDPEDGFRLRSGDASTLKSAYAARMAAHLEGLRRLANSLGWTLTTHRTDRPASEALMRLSMIMSNGVRT
jgi:uncharacterized protein (DUF58 family)